MSHAKYVITGLFVIGGLVLVATLIIWFEGVASVLRGGYTVRAHLPNSMGLRKGKPVHRDGIAVGEVSAVTSSLPERPGVWVVMQIGTAHRIPQDARLVATSNAMGDTALDFRTTEVPTGGYLPTDGSATVTGAPEPYSFLPEEVTGDLSEAVRSLAELKPLVANLTELTEPRTLADVEAGLPRNLTTTLLEFSETARSVKALADDPDTKALVASAKTSADELGKTLVAARATLAEIEKTFKDVGTRADGSLASLQKTSDAWRQTAGNVDLLLQRISDNADQVDRLVGHLTAIAAGVREGKGTAGKFLTDPHLHNALVTLVENLNALSTNARRLITLWREEGILAKEEK